MLASKACKIGYFFVDCDKVVRRPGLNLSRVENVWYMLEGCAFSATCFWRFSQSHHTLDLVTTREDKNTIQNLSTINLHLSDHMSVLVHQVLKRITANFQALMLLLFGMMSLQLHFSPHQRVTWTIDVINIPTHTHTHTHARTHTYIHYLFQHGKIFGELL